MSKKMTWMTNKLLIDTEANSTQEDIINELNAHIREN